MMYLLNRLLIFFQKGCIDVVAVAAVAVPKFNFEERKFLTKMYRLGLGFRVVVERMIHYLKRRNCTCPYFVEYTTLKLLLNSKKSNTFHPPSLSRIF